MTRPASPRMAADWWLAACFVLFVAGMLSTVIGMLFGYMIPSFGELDAEVNYGWRAWWNEAPSWGAMNDVGPRGFYINWRLLTFMEFGGILAAVLALAGAYPVVKRRNEREKSERAARLRANMERANAPR